MHSEALGYILRLFRIIKPSSTLLYLLTLTEILINNSMQYNLFQYVVVMNGTLKKIVVSSCAAWGMDNYLWSAKLHTRNIY